MGSQEENPDSGGQESPVLYTHHRMAENPEIWKAVAMADHFEKIQKLAEPIPGCPNFRRVPGYKVYCCGQPTVEGFEKALEKVCGSIYAKDGKIMRFNLRQEPSVYVDGMPLCARPPNKIGEYAELGNVERDKLKEDELEFVRVCQGKMKDNGDKLKYVDVNKQEAEVEVKSIVPLHDVVEGLKEKFPGLVHMRIPICNSASPLEKDFDTLSSGTWWRRVKESYSGREISQLLPSPTSSLSPPLTSRPTLAKSSTTSTRPPTPCSPTCPRETTRREPSTGSPPRPS